MPQINAGVLWITMKWTMAKKIDKSYPVRINIKDIIDITYTYRDGGCFPPSGSGSGPTPIGSINPASSQKKNKHKHGLRQRGLPSDPATCLITFRHRRFELSTPRGHYRRRRMQPAPRGSASSMHLGTVQRSAYVRWCVSVASFA